MPLPNLFISILICIKCLYVIYNIFFQMLEMHKRTTEVRNIQIAKQDSIEIGPIQRPTIQEFQDFASYMKTLQLRYRDRYGLVKVIPPPEWKPRSTPYSYQLQSLVVKNPIEQNAEGKGGIYEFKHIASPSMTYQTYVHQNSTRDEFISNKSPSQIQQLFWKSIVYSPPLYGADLVGTLMDQASGKWNLDNLDTVLKYALNQKLRGVNTSYCYIGSWKSLFCWHKEDLDLSAINFVHFGKPKFWYCIQSEDGKYLENEAKKHFPAYFNKCPQYLRHKTLLINPYILKKNYPNIKICKMKQNQGQFIIAFGGAYHAGFNFGCNVAEAVNFATYSWLQKFQKARLCVCRKSSVKASYQRILMQLSQHSHIFNHPEFTKIWQRSGLEKNTQQEDEQRHQKSNRIKPIAKLQKKKSFQNKKAVKKIKKEKQVQVENFVKCDSCRTWRKIPKNQSQSLKKYSNNKFLCKMFNKSCKKNDDNKIEDEQEYKPYK